LAYYRVSAGRVCRALIHPNLARAIATQSSEYGARVVARPANAWPKAPGRLNVEPELKRHVLVPDVLLQPHNASLEMTFYGGRQFPADYKGDIFAAEHGS